MTTAETILQDLREYDFPRAYHTRFVTFGTQETDEAAAIAASTPVGALVAQDEVQEFLHSLWSLTTSALDHGEHHQDHKPALMQLEQELGHMVMTLRGQAINRF